MNREIEFRAWNLERKKMYIVATLNLRKEWFGCLAYDSQNDCVGDTIGLNYYDEQFKEIELMQYTGLKDKNGKKIFEGDILLHKWVVYYDNETATFKMRKNKRIRSLHYHLEQYGQIEIIGNQYENELLRTD